MITQQAAAMPGARGFWRGPTFPFQFNGGDDFTTASDAEQLKAAIRQIMMTHGRTPGHEGECPWDTQFGSALDFIRHSSDDEATLRDLATYYIGSALGKYEPRIQVRGVELKKSGDTVSIRVLFSARGAQGRDAKIEEAEVVMPLEA